jgi:hypothetical protein
LFLHRLLLMPSSLSCQLICEVPFCSFECLAVLLHCHSWTTVIRCGYHWKRHHGASHSCDFLPLVFVPLGSGASWILLCTEWSFWKLSGNLSGIWDYKHISKGFCYNKKLFY